MTPVKRKRVTRKERAAIFAADKGICYLCNLPVRPGEDWDVEHEIALEAGGKDEPSNWRVAHRIKCHPEKTKKDRKVIAKVQRLHDTHIGGKPETSRKIINRGFTKKHKEGRIDRLPIPKRTHMFGIPIDDIEGGKDD